MARKCANSQISIVRCPHHILVTIQGQTSRMQRMLRHQRQVDVEQVVQRNDWPGEVLILIEDKIRWYAHPDYMRFEYDEIGLDEKVVVPDGMWRLYPSLSQIDDVYSQIRMRKGECHEHGQLARKCSDCEAQLIEELCCVQSGVVKAAQQASESLKNIAFVLSGLVRDDLLKEIDEAKKLLSDSLNDLERVCR